MITRTAETLTALNAALVVEARRERHAGRLAPDVEVMGTCFATAQAAGVAALLAGRGQPVSGTPQRLRESFGNRE